MKNAVKNPKVQAQNAGFITLFMGLFLMVYAIIQANVANWNHNEALRENYLVVFIFSTLVMAISFVTIYSNRQK